MTINVIEMDRYDTMLDLWRNKKRNMWQRNAWVVRKGLLEELALTMWHLQEYRRNKKNKGLVKTSR